ncbi:MAG TPA: NDP-sugar synthase [Candidatus Methylomirabilis sp.]|nr:NDP-sugar synthase [Candidatus Methylomirabilis sp.]
MDAIIMSAGRGSRLRPLTDTTPKPLIPILGRGTLHRTLDILPQAVTRIIIVVGYRAPQIREAFGTEFGGCPVVYITQDPLDGTGGCLRRVREQMPDLSEHFLVMNGDDLYAGPDLEALAASERGVLVLETRLNKEEDSWVRDERGALLGLTRTPAGELGLVNAGAYCLDHGWFGTEPVQVPGKPFEWSLPHALPQIIARGVPIMAVSATFWMPVGTPEELTRAEQTLR